MQPAPIKPPERDPKEIATDEYQKACDDAKEELLKKFPIVMDQVRKGKIDVPQNQKEIALDILRQEHRRFHTSGRIPWSVFMRPYVDPYLDELKRAKLKVRAFYRKRIEALNFPQSDQLEQDLKVLLGNEVMAKWQHVYNGFEPGLLATLYSNGRVDLGSDSGDWHYSKGWLFF